MARGFSGAWYQLRPLDTKRHMFAGGLPPSLAAVIEEGEEGVAKLLQEISRPDQTPEEQEQSRSVVRWLDKLVMAEVCMDPPLTEDDFGDPTDLQAESVIPDEDYLWLIAVAMRQTEHDAEGRRLFGFEPELKFVMFREMHGCPDDCPACEEAAKALQALTET